MKNNLSELLSQSLSTFQLELIRLVAADATALGLPLYIVGGFVRDILIGHGNLDIDLVVEGNAPKLARDLVEKYGGKVTVHSRFGTAKWDIRDSRIRTGNFLSNIDPPTLVPDFLDLVSARSESYKSPASLPTVKMGKIEDDLRRRDFTINSLALRLDGPYFGELRNDHGGVEDLKLDLVRVLHNRSFIDDPTRMYRAVRYEKRFGLRIADETLALIPEALGYVNKLSPQRIRHELDLILVEPNNAPILSRLAELGLLKPIHAALPWDESVRVRFQHKHQPELLKGRNDERLTAWLIWLMALSKKQIESLNKRLHFTAPLLKNLLSASQLFAGLGTFIDLKASRCVEYLDEVPLQAVYAVFLSAPEGSSKHRLMKYLSEWRHVRPSITGHDLKKRGIPPGPVYQKVLRELRNAWLDDEVQNVEEEKDWLDARLRRL